MTPSEMVARIAKLELENERLTEERDHYRRECEQAELVDFAKVFLPATLDVRSAVAEIIARLWSARGRTVTFGALLDMLELKGFPALETLRVYISHARRVLGKAAVVNVRDSGYLLTEEGLARVDALKARHKAEYHV